MYVRHSNNISSTEMAENISINNFNHVFTLSARDGDHIMSMSMSMSMVKPENLDDDCYSSCYAVAEKRLSKVKVVYDAT